MAREPMPISSWWLQGAILTYLVGFSVLGILAYLAYEQQPPIPGRVIDPAGRTIFTHADVIEGMNVFQRYGVMEYGTVYGHGAYLGPDFTAEYLHKSGESLLRAYGARPETAASAAALVARELHENSYDPARDVLPWSGARAAAHRELLDYYRQVFQSKTSGGGRQAAWITDSEQIRKLTAFFGWTAWTATATRPGADYSYTNNWPPDRLVGNSVTAEAVTWSVISIIGLLGGTGVILFLFGRYDWLGWGKPRRNISLRPVEEFALTPAQRAVVWFLVVSSLLFLLQTLLGGLAAHYRAEPGDFFGYDISRIIPFNIARTWHLQLAIFWVSASFLATGIFIAPLIAGREPRGQGALTVVLLGAVAFVVFGSLIGEYAGISGWLGSQEWFWLGAQGWEYIDLGRMWQILLIVGLFLWVFILWRGLRGTLRTQHYGRMPWLLFYAALAIPVFYAVGLLASRSQGFRHYGFLALLGRAPLG